jgi:hypothetical protein
LRVVVVVEKLRYYVVFQAVLVLEEFYKEVYQI